MSAALLTIDDVAERLQVSPYKARQIVLARRCKLDRPFPPWTDGSCIRDLATACVRAGIEKATPNDFRRTFASWLSQAGIPERVIADLLGHEDTVLVRAVYGHLDRATLASAVAKL